MGGEESAPGAVDILAGHPVNARPPVVQRALGRLDPELSEPDLCQPCHGGLLGGFVAAGEQGRAIRIFDPSELPLIVRLDLGRLAALAIVERQAQDIDQSFAGGNDTAKPCCDDRAALDDDSRFGLWGTRRRIGGNQLRRRLPQCLAGGDDRLLGRQRSDTADFGGVTI